MGAFADLGPEISFRQVPLTEVARAHADTIGNVKDVWTFPDERFVYGIRLLRPAELVPADNTERPTTIYWRSSNQLFSKERRGVHWWSPDESSATFWIYSQVTEFAVGAESGTAPQVMLLVH